MPLIDSLARERIRTVFDKTLVVEAAAGTGKTTELVARIVALLSSGTTTVGRVVGVTFTEKAAGELKLRLRSELENARRSEKNPEARGHLEHALAHLEEARLSTIHSFCGDLLRERPVEAEIDPEVNVMSEAESRQLYREAFHAWFQGKLEDLPQGTRRMLRRRTRNAPPDSLSAAGWELANWRDFPAPWQRPPFDRTAAIDALVEKFHRLAELTAEPSEASNNLFLDTARARELSREIGTAEKARPRDYDGLEATLVLVASDRRFEPLRKPRKGKSQYNRHIKREQIFALHQELIALLESFVDEANSDLAALLQAELGETVAEYQRLKERAGRLDFLDLLIRTRDLLVQSASVRRYFQERFTHLFVDEFQDTDPLQAEILVLLSADHPQATNWRTVRPQAGKLFIVADPKQAIYRFRRADVGTYEEVKQLLLGQGAELLQLTTSFRSLPSIQALINRAFAPAMDGNADTLQAGYVPLSPFREDYPGQPSIVALPVPRPYKRMFSMEAVEASLPDAIAAFVEWLVGHSGWTIATPGDPQNRVPLGPNHVCLLFRRFVSGDDDIARPYLRALEARNLPHLLVGGKSFHDREEVQTLRAALTAIEWPDDELSVFATLKGSLFAIPDEVLLEYRHRMGPFHPFRLPADPLSGELQDVVESLRMLAKLHRGRNRCPVEETIDRLLRATRAHLAFALRPSGEQVLANVLHIRELARRYEVSGGLSFRGFVEDLNGGTGAAEAAEAPIFEEGGEGIRMMSVHKAKGLEFPVVILADITAKISRQQPSRHIDARAGLCAIPLAGCEPLDLHRHAPLELARDRAEGVRLAYVSATRARDLLVVPTIGDDPRRSWGSVENWWVRPLYDALYPLRENRQKPGAAVACPKFGKDSVLMRPPDFVGDEADTVCPGLHHFAEPGMPDRGYGVVWWDPRALTLDVPQRFGIRQEELLKEPSDPEILRHDLSSYEGWRKGWEEVREKARTPSVTFRTVTAEARHSHSRSPAPEVELIELPRERERPSGARFGALVHAALASVPLDANGSQIEQLVSLHAKVLAAHEEEKEGAVLAVGRALAHPLLGRARKAWQSGQCRRETPITITQSDGTLLEGILDLAFLEDNKWVVVDFKTDRELEVALETYLRQVAVYAKAVSWATQQEASPIIMRV
ncbi:MAG TPA: UvrD-helicase domain-containing protein [Terriglobales bacterium]|nr:UvrD-helicase domain-containing protein [Terriglobales bacterium]